MRDAWLLLVAPGCSWLLLVAPGCSPNIDYQEHTNGTHDHSRRNQEHTTTAGEQAGKQQTKQILLLYRYHRTK